MKTIREDEQEFYDAIAEAWVSVTSGYPEIRLSSQTISPSPTPVRAMTPSQPPTDKLSNLRIASSEAAMVLGVVVIWLQDQINVSATFVSSLEQQKNRLMAAIKESHKEMS